MQELINRLTEKAGVTTEQATKAIEAIKEFVKEIEWKENAPEGKMDLVVDLNFRMDTSALYSDIVLPAASWYEKADLVIDSLSASDEEAASLIAALVRSRGAYL